MCVIVYQPGNERLTKKEARALWNQNPDGGGLAYVHGKRIIVYRSLVFNEWWKQYRMMLHKHPQTEALIHFRIATHGSVNLANTHPFWTDRDTVMAHNGIIYDCLPNSWEDISDTRVFVEDFLPNLPEGWLDNEYLSLMVSSFVNPSRLAFLTVNPNAKHSIYRFGRFEKLRGLYLSNKYGLEPKPVYATTSKGFTTIGNDYKYKSKPYYSNVTVDEEALEESSKEDEEALEDELLNLALAGDEDAIRALEEWWSD